MEALSSRSDVSALAARRGKAHDGDVLAEPQRRTPVRRPAMHHRTSWRRVAAIAALVIPSTVFGANRAGLEKLVPPDGMTRTKVKGFGVAYVQPHAALGSYDKVLMDPVSVEYRRDWDPERTGSRIQISDEQREALRAGVATSVHDAFAKALQQGGRYRIVDEPGTGVLKV